jgi:hypothetical protein
MYAFYMHQWHPHPLHQLVYRLLLIVNRHTQRPINLLLEAAASLHHHRPDPIVPTRRAINNEVGHLAALPAMDTHTHVRSRLLLKVHSQSCASKPRPSEAPLSPSSPERDFLCWYSAARRGEEVTNPTPPGRRGTL